MFPGDLIKMDNNDFQGRVLDFIERVQEQLGRIEAHSETLSNRVGMQEADIEQLNKEVNRAHGAIALLGLGGGIVAVLKAIGLL